MADDTPASRALRAFTRRFRPTPPSKRWVAANTGQLITRIRAQGFLR